MRWSKNVPITCFGRKWHADVLMNPKLAYPDYRRQPPPGVMADIGPYSLPHAWESESEGDMTADRLRHRQLSALSKQPEFAIDTGNAKLLGQGACQDGHDTTRSQLRNRTHRTLSRPALVCTSSSAESTNHGLLVGVDQRDPGKGDTRRHSFERTRRAMWCCTEGRHGLRGPGLLQRAVSVT